jgi:hypothetical protein
VKMTESIRTKVVRQDIKKTLGYKQRASTHKW